MGIVTILIPYLVPTVSLLLHCYHKKNMAAVGRRFVKYLLWYAVFCICYFIKRLQPFDFSDHVIMGVIGLTIVSEEVSCVWKSRTDPSVNLEDVLEHRWQCTVVSL